MSDMRDEYLELLERSYSHYLCFDNDRMYGSKLDFLGESVFDFTTYDDDMTEVFAERALQVCESITTRQTFVYIQNDDNYAWYLLMCNMPFFVKKINWGTSIRGAWWEHDGISLKPSYELYDKNDKQIVKDMNFSRDEWNEFVYAMIEFAYGD